MTRASSSNTLTRLRLEAELAAQGDQPVTLSPKLLLQLLNAAERAPRLLRILAPFASAGYTMQQLAGRLSGFNPDQPPDIRAMIEKMAMILAREDLTPEDFRRAMAALQDDPNDHGKNIARQPDPRSADGA